MKLIKQYKTFSIFIFILFLLIGFTLFAYVNNSFIGLSFGRRVLVDFMFLIMIAIGVIMFYVIENKHDIIVHETVKQSQIVELENEGLLVPHGDTNDVPDDYKLIDIKNILPQSLISLEKYAEELLKNMADEFNIVQGLFYFRQPGSDLFQCRAQFAYYSDTKPPDFKFGETLPGQAVKNKKTVSLSKIPENYLTVVSGLGKGAPNEIIFLPVIFDGEVIALIEYATFGSFNEKIGENLNLVAKKIAGILVKLSKK